MTECDWIAPIPLCHPLTPHPLLCAGQLLQFTFPFSFLPLSPFSLPVNLLPLFLCFFHDFTLNNYSNWSYRSYIVRVSTQTNDGHCLDILLSGSQVHDQLHLAKQLNIDSRRQGLQRFHSYWALGCDMGINPNSQAQEWFGRITLRPVLEHGKESGVTTFQDFSSGEPACGKP